MKAVSYIYKGLAVALVLASVLCAPLSVARADGFVEPNRTNLYNTLIRFGALTIFGDDVIDEYLMVNECELYRNFFSDDFKWQKIRQAVRAKIKMDVEGYPTGYAYNTTLQLGRYDFKEHIFRFSTKTQVRNVNAIVIFVGRDVTCGSKTTHVLPINYRVVFDHSIYVDGLPLAEADAKALLKRMEENKNVDRLVYTRFNIRVAYVAGLTKDPGEQIYKQHTQSSSEQTLRLDGRLDSVDFYEDEAMTKLIYTYREGTF